MARQDFIDAAASEKITLARVEATKRFINYTDLGSGIYSKAVPYFCSELKSGDGFQFTQGANASVAQGEFYYDVQASTLYLHMPDSSDPNSAILISTVQLFFATHPVSVPHDLDETSNDVFWNGRITQSPNFKSQIGINQNLVSTIGSGTLNLANSDGGLDDIYDDLIFENQDVDIYSLNRKQPLSEAKLIFRGIVHDKSYSSDDISFILKDQLFNLLENVPQSLYDENDNVNSDIVGRPKRWVYGRVDGLQVQSIDQIGSGFNLTGTVSVLGESVSVTGIGTLFLSEASPDDKIFIGSQEFSIESIQSDTALTLDDESAFNVTNSLASIVPETPTTNKNRDFFVAEHATAELNRTVVSALQFNRVKVDDTTGILEGDILEFPATSERIEVKNVAPGNIIVLRQNLLQLPTIGDSVIRQPIQDVFINGSRIINEDYTINNASGETTIVIDTDAEFNIAPIQNLNQSLTFTNGSRIITGGTELTQVLKPRDFIRPEGAGFVNFYEILDVEDDQITLRINFADVSTTDTAEIKTPEYIGDNTIISVNVLGRTADDTPNGEWIQTSAEVVRDLVDQIGLTDRINETSFTETSLKTPQLVSLTIPLSPTDSSPTVKDTADIMGQSTNCALTLDNNLDLTYKSTLIFTNENITIIGDKDVIRWSVKSKSGKLYKFSNINYRHVDVDRFTLESGSNLATKTSTFVTNFVGTSKTIEQNVYLYNEFDARIFSERILYYNSLSLAEITMESDLRLEGLEIGDVVQLEFSRLYRRLGDNSRKKLAAVSGKQVSGDRIKLTLTDYGNTFNTSSFITANDAPNYTASDEDNKLNQGYITDGQGIVDDVEETAEINKIS